VRPVPAASRDRTVSRPLRGRAAAAAGAGAGRGNLYRPGRQNRNDWSDGQCLGADRTPGTAGA